MPLPRFRTRTLMIAVAVAGVAFWAVGSGPRGRAEIGLPVVLTIVPVVGAFWRGFASHDRFEGAILGGFVGATIDAAAVAVVCAYLFVPGLVHRPPKQWFLACGFAIGFMLVCFAWGIIAGLYLGIGLRRGWFSMAVPECPEAAMRLPRFTTRRLTVLVAAVAMVLGGVRLWRLRSSYLERAALHRRLEASSRRIAKYAGALSRIGAEPPGADAALNKRAEYRAELGRKYEHAARYPWLPVPPGPPPPE